jgi:hypothetical protein
MNRKIICYTCGREIPKVLHDGKKLTHCNACGVNYCQDCFCSIQFSLAEEGVSRPNPEDAIHKYIMPGDFPSWMDLGKMWDLELFMRYLLGLFKKFKHGNPRIKPVSQFLCNACHVDTDFAVADIGLINQIIQAQSRNQDTIIISEEQTEKFTSCDFIKDITNEELIICKDLIKIQIPNQIELINKVMGTNWQAEKMPGGYRLVRTTFI